MKALLAIDQSTSGTKAVLLALEGTVLHRVSCEHRQYYPAPGLVEHDAEEIWRNVLARAAKCWPGYRRPCITSPV